MQILGQDWSTAVDQCLQQTVVAAVHGGRIDQPLHHDRRAEMDLPVWLCSETIGQVEGQLVNLSMGGAAIRAEMEVEKGDQVEFWSVDIRWLPPITVVVLHAEGEGNKRRFNLQFVKAPSGVLRAAILELQRAVSGMVRPIREQAV